jgi:hypothetical protein
MIDEIKIFEKEIMQEILRIEANKYHCLYNNYYIN